MSDNTDHHAARPAPQFDAAFKDAFRDLLLWRRDVRRFRSDPVEEALIHDLIELATHAPSVGNAQPWRFVLVESTARRARIEDSFKRANDHALKGYDGEQRQRYANLKLEGLSCAPVHIALFADETTTHGAGLGRQTMPETIRYSVVGAIHALWLAARMHGLGMGWVSILEPNAVTEALEVPQSWSLVAYLCLGWPRENHLDPELVRHHWQDRLPLEDVILRR